MRRPLVFVLPTLSLILLLLMACGDGLSGRATGDNVADMERLEDQLSLVSENMAALNEENSGLMELIEDNRAYSDDLAIWAEELSDTTSEEIQGSLSDGRAQLERDRASIQIASDASNRIVSELLDIIGSDIEYLLMQSGEEVEMTSREDFNEILGGLVEIRYEMENVTRPNLTLVERALEEIDAANIMDDGSLDWHLDLGSDSGSVRISETGSYTFEMWLWSQPSTDAVLSIVSGDTEEVTVSPATLTFTNSNWDSAQTVTLTGVDDTDDDGDQHTTITVSGVGDNWADDGETFTVVTEDDDDVTLTVVTEDDDLLDWGLDRGGDEGNVEISETGSSYTFEMLLLIQPPSDAVLSIVSGDTGEVTVSPATLTFTNSNWDSAQTVTLTGVNDTDVDGDQTTIVTVSGVGDVWRSINGETLTVVTEDDN